MEVAILKQASTPCPGSIVVEQLLRDFLNQPPVATDYKYRRNKLLSRQPAVARFTGQMIASSAAVTRLDFGSNAIGRYYDSVVGLELLSKKAYAFDFRSMKMWLYNPDEK